MLRELREFGEPRSSDWGTSEILLLRGDEASEREEREVVVAAEAELPGRLEGMRRRGKTREEDMGGGTGEQRRGKASRREIIRELNGAEDRCPVLSPTVK